ncbi:hypothetical protein SteCoe_14132 [Stentor coeruleus]|uniref:Major facilitator superfamily (MFS) profile domain-containing protein n=1 Tax=Stentor coeruleus TaxID=5963 RepID=A0A1R2C6P3_9CILI|nr:hypothetical protein SteCoe_14132 [Stentor coeruleus]
MENEEDSKNQIQNTEENLSGQVINSKIRTRVFFIMVCANALLNYDTGVIPASLDHLDIGSKLSHSEQAAIGSLVYFGICTSSLIVSIVFQRFSASKVLIIMLIFNSIFCLLFSFSYNVYFMYITRFGMGFTQAFSVIYAPVWTNEFAPCGICTRWMGILQCAVPLGVVFGYGIASLFNSLNIPFLDWRFAIQLQAVFEIPIILSLKFIDKSYIDIINPQDLVSSGEKSQRGKEVRIDTISLTHLSGFCEQMKMLYKNQIFIFLTLSLCCMFFVVSGIQYWITQYCIKVLHAKKIFVIIGFIIISTTAPIFGVITGGWVTDYYGGYKGKNILTAMRICFAFGSMAFISAIPSCFVQTVFVEIFLLWLLLFFGGCIVPAATGIIVNSVHKEFQSSSSSISQLIFNFGGFFLSPLMSAVIMDLFTDEIDALTWGFRFTLSASFLSLVFIGLAFSVIIKGEIRYKVQSENSEVVEDNSLENLQEIIRRVKPIAIS